MKTWKPVAVGIAALAATMVTFVPDLWKRGVQPLSSPADGTAASEPFDPQKSAALFIGVQKFTLDPALNIPYAVDDAVDLAHAFALDRGNVLVPPERVVLVISGQPRKEESRRKLKELERAAAKIVQPATQGEILTYAEDQAALADREGIFIVSLASHGFLRDGVPYFLGSSSLFRLPDTTISVARLADIADRSPARRSLLLIDACRERLADGTRAGGPNLMTAAPLIRRMKNIDGQVIFYAAAAGRYAYDDPKRMNGVFTRAIVDGLNCKATATRGVVTVEALHAYVERDVKEWIRRHRDPSIDVATQISMDGMTKNMPLAKCPKRSIPGAPASVTTSESIITVFDENGTPLWRRDLGSRVVSAEVIHFDEDGKPEILVGAQHAAQMYDHRGERLWWHEERLRLRALTVGDLYRKERKIVGLWRDAHSSRVSVHTGPDDEGLTWDYPDDLTHLTLARPTTRHAPRILVSNTTEVLLVDPKKTKPVWRYAIPSGKFARLEIVHHNHDDRNDIAVITTQGRTFFLDFDGKLIGRE